MEFLLTHFTTASKHIKNLRLVKYVQNFKRNEKDETELLFFFLSYTSVSSLRIGAMSFLLVFPWDLVQ